MNVWDDLEDPILMDCPGSGCPATLSTVAALWGWTTTGTGDIYGHCQFDHSIHRLDGDRNIPAHQTVDIIAMIARGDFGPRSAKNRSKA